MPPKRGVGPPACPGLRRLVEPLFRLPSTTAPRPAGSPKSSSAGLLEPCPATCKCQSF